jgi:hypothetical protein
MILLIEGKVNVGHASTPELFQNLEVADVVQ